MMTNTVLTRSLVLLLLGPPGCGKGTQAEPLSGELRIPHISTGNLFREHIRGQTPLGKKAKEFMDLGKLVPDELVLDMLFERIGEEDCKRGYILDGFPRTLPQAEAFEKRLGSETTLIAVSFTLSDETLIERIVGRLACAGCGRSYHLRFSPPTRERICDQCNSSLYQRDDDKEEIVKKRLQVYRAQTAPLLDHYASKEGVLREVKSQGSKEQVFKEVMEVIS
jgi:adenylate kinase